MQEVRTPPLLCREGLFVSLICSQLRAIGNPNRLSGPAFSVALVAEGVCVSAGALFIVALRSQWRSLSSACSQAGERWAHLGLE